MRTHPLPLVLGLGLVLLTQGARAELPSTVAAGAKLVEVYADDRFFEGPTWDPVGKKLYFTAFAADNQQILRLEPNGKASVWADHTEGVNGTRLSLDGGLIGAQAYGHRIVRYDFKQAEPPSATVLLYDAKLHQPNDLCQTPDGTIYFTDPDFKNRKTSAVYRLKAGEMEATKVIDEMDLPNGVIASLDGKTLYVGDSYLKLWRSYPIQTDGGLGKGKVFFDPKTENRNDPDGMSIDVKGNLYLTGRGGVWVVSPEGKPLGLIEVPEFCSNVGFGGVDGKTLYLTCSKKVYSLAMNVVGGLLGPVSADVRNHVTEGFVDSDGVKIHYASMGKGPLLVMIHGFPDFWYTWRTQMPALAKTHQVVAIDQRGFNLSDQPKGVENYTMDKLVGDVEAVLRHFKADKAVIVGHDWGGMVAWSFAMKNPAKTDKLIVLNLPHPRGLIRELKTNPEQQRNSKYARDFQKPEAAKLIFPSMLTFWVTDPDARAVYAEAMRKSSIEGMLNYYKANYPKEPYERLTADFPPIKCSVLLIHGLKDTALLPGALNDTWKWVESDLTLITLPKAGHFVQQDAGNEVTRAMVSWLAR